MTDFLIHERLARIESRLVQLMLYLGMNPYGKNEEGGFIAELRDTQDRSKVGTGPDDNSDAHGPDWTALEAPACTRRGRDTAIRGAISTEEA